MRVRHDAPLFLLMEIFDPFKGLGDSSTAGGKEGPVFVKGSVLKARVLSTPVPGQARLKVGPRLIQAVMSQHVEPGREVSLLVAETSPRLVLRVMTGPEPGPGQAPGLRPGYEPPSAQVSASGPEPELRDQVNQPVLRARVTDFPAPDKIRIQILNLPSPSRTNPSSQSDPGRLNLKVGQEVTARLVPGRTGPELIPGKTALFVVTETSPRLVLKIQTQPEPQAGPLVKALAQFLHQPDGLAQGAAQLLKTPPYGPEFPFQVQARALALVGLVSGLSPEAETADPGFLARLTGLLGLAGERSPVQEATARLLPELIRSPQMEDLKTDPKLRALVEASAGLYKAADSLQALNQETLGRDQTLHLAFPLLWSGQEGRGELLLEPPREARDDGTRPYRVTLLLTFSRLGRVKFDLSLREKTIKGAIWTESPGARTVVGQALGRLVRSLEARGFEVADLSARTFPPDRPPPDSLAEEILIRHEGLIDLKV